MLLTPYPKIQFLDDFGAPLSGGKVYTYAIGTTTLQATYQDKDGLIINTNPVILDSAGRGIIWLQDLNYTFLIHNSADVLQGSGGDIKAAAALDSPGFSGVPTAPTAVVGTNTTQLATTAFVEAAATGGLSWVGVKTANFTAVNGEGYPVDTTAASYTLTLPITPALDTQVGYKDFAGTFQTNPLLFNLNGELFEGVASYSVGSKGAGGILVFVGGTQGWVLVADVKPYAPNKPVTGVYRTGGIDGGGIESHTATTVTMRPFSCIADDGVTQIYKSTSTIVDLGTPAINTDYHLFMVKNTDGTYGYKADTNIDGTGLTGVASKRWDAYVPVDSAGSIQPLWMHGSEIFFSNQATMYVTTTLTTSFVEYSLSAILPVTRIDSISLKSLTIIASWAAAFDGTTRQLDLAAPNAGQVTREVYMPIANSIWLRASSNASITVSSVKLKR